jgi:hypothetical protein
MAFSSYLSLITLEQIVNVASTGIEFRFNGYELGHPQCDQQADLPFPVRVREELMVSGVSAHHILPETGWVRYSLNGPESVPGPNVPF